MTKILGKVFNSLRLKKTKVKGRFYYPQKGFGQICQALAKEVMDLGGEIQLATFVEEIYLRSNQPIRLKLRPTIDSNPIKPDIPEPEYDFLEADFVFSTIPITVLVNLLRPKSPTKILKSSTQLDYRSMVILYIILETNQFSPYDAHYFPEESVIFSRMSEPKNYSASQIPENHTGLCFEIPCNYNDHIWNKSLETLTKTVCEDLKKIGLPINYRVKTAFIKHLPRVYPIYHCSFENNFQILDDYLTQIPGLVSLGRQGLFVHDNTHHTIEMAYRASECLRPDLSWDSAMWEIHREHFSKNVVED